MEAEWEKRLKEGFPISRDPPEGGTSRRILARLASILASFQFLGIPPKGELVTGAYTFTVVRFPISRDPPEGGTVLSSR